MSRVNWPTCHILALPINREKKWSEAELFLLYKLGENVKGGQGTMTKRTFFLQDSFVSLVRFCWERKIIGYVIFIILRLPIKVQRKTKIIRITLLHDLLSYLKKHDSEKKQLVHFFSPTHLYERPQTSLFFSHLVHQVNCEDWSWWVIDAKQYSGLIYYH